MNQNPETPKTFEPATEAQANRLAQEAEVLVSVIGWPKADNLKQYQTEDIDIPLAVQENLHTAEEGTVVKDSLLVETVWDPRATMASLAGISFTSRESKEGSDAWSESSVSYYVKAEPNDADGLESHYVFSKSTHFNEHAPGNLAKEEGPRKFVAPSKEVFHEMLRQADLTAEAEEALGLNKVSTEEAEQLIQYLAELTVDVSEEPIEQN
jgi:hypothetical protein